MPFELSSTLKQAKGVRADDFINVVENTTDLVYSENGQIGNLAITGRLITIAPVGEALIIGDLHGDITSLRTILEKSKFINQMNTTCDASLVFLGDYGDRGASQIELYYTILNLKLAFPEQVVLLRGNHEGPLDLMSSPHDLPHQLQHKFKDKGVFAYVKLRKLFDCLYNAAYVADRYLMAHGGLPSATRNLQEIAHAAELHPDKPFLEELLWSDPDETVTSVLPSPRGAGNLFGKTITNDVLKKLEAKILIRGHELATNGYKINHEGKVITLFSRKGAPYFNARGAYLNVPLSEKFEAANHLVPYIHVF